VNPDVIAAANRVRIFLEERATRAGRPYNNPLITSWHGVELREPDLRLLVDAATPPAHDEPLGCGESVTAWHTIRIFDGPDLLEPEKIVRQYEAYHPDECRTLPPGAACWLHHAPMREHWPTQPGSYRIRIETVITGGIEEPDWDSFLIAERTDEDDDASTVHVTALGAESTKTIQDAHPTDPGGTVPEAAGASTPAWLVGPGDD
jgi:hypothetical protein